MRTIGLLKANMALRAQVASRAGQCIEIVSFSNIYVLYRGGEKCLRRSPNVHSKEK